MSFTTDNRALPLWQTCAYGNVPIFRALALALEHARENGARFTVLSADRRDRLLARFNKRHGTHLHGQQYLFDHQREPGFSPANAPGRSSHCLFSDGHPAYRISRRFIGTGARLPRYFLGIDACDTGPGSTANDCSLLIRTLERLGYHVTRPYCSESEAHHFSFTSDPTPVLLYHGRISPAARSAAKPAPIGSLSTRGATFIARFEGFAPRLYNDPGEPPNATIGFGHVVHPGPINGNETLMTVSRAEALELLRRDCARAAAAVRRHVKQPLTQEQFDALVSFTYNCGEGSLATSTLLSKLNGGDFAAVPAELERWVHAGTHVLPGLVRRRKAEAALFSKGTY